MLCHQAGRGLVFWGITITVCGPDYHLCTHRTENPVAVVLNNSRSRQPPEMEGELFSLHEERHRGRYVQQQSECNLEAGSFNKQPPPSFPRGYVAWHLAQISLQQWSHTAHKAFSFLPITVSSLFAWSALDFGASLSLRTPHSSHNHYRSSVSSPSDCRTTAPTSQLACPHVSPRWLCSSSGWCPMLMGRSALPHELVILLITYTNYNTHLAQSHAFKTWVNLHMTCAHDNSTESKLKWL